MKLVIIACAMACITSDLHAQDPDPSWCTTPECSGSWIAFGGFSVYPVVRPEFPQCTLHVWYRYRFCNEMFEFFVDDMRWYSPSDPNDPNAPCHDFLNAYLSANASGTQAEFLRHVYDEINVQLARSTFQEYYEGLLLQWQASPNDPDILRQIALVTCPNGFKQYKGYMSPCAFAGHYINSGLDSRKGSDRTILDDPYQNYVGHVRWLRCGSEEVCCWRLFTYCVDENGHTHETVTRSPATTVDCSTGFDPSTVNIAKKDPVEQFTNCVEYCGESTLPRSRILSPDELRLSLSLPTK